MMLCPLCQKEIDPPAAACPRCRADVSLLADHMDAVQTRLDRADAHRKAGELADAVSAYLEILDMDPTNTAARTALGPVLLAVRSQRYSPGCFATVVAVVAILSFIAGATCCAYVYAARQV